jgi:hypothetical protein
VFFSRAYAVQNKGASCMAQRKDDKLCQAGIMEIIRACKNSSLFERRLESQVIDPFSLPGYFRYFLLFLYIYFKFSYFGSSRFNKNDELKYNPFRIKKNSLK